MILANSVKIFVPGCIFKPTLNEFIKKSPKPVEPDQLSTKEPRDIVECIFLLPPLFSTHTQDPGAPNSWLAAVLLAPYAGDLVTN